jgi:UDP-glucose 4-epimerase
VRDGRPLAIFGDGAQTRDFVFVADVVRANLLALDADSFGVFNVASGSATSIIQLARSVQDVAGRTVGEVFEPARLGDVLHSAGDPALARERLGFVAEIGLREGLGRTLGS